MVSCLHKVLRYRQPMSTNSHRSEHLKSSPSTKLARNATNQPRWDFVWRVLAYLFWAFVCTLPLLLFWNNVRNKVWLILLAITLAMLPLPSFNYAVFTVGNLKFVFLFIAFLLLVKRHELANTSKWIYVLDAGI